MLKIIKSLLPISIVLSIGLAEANTEANNATVLEEIVVTVQHRSENLQEVPVAVSVLNQSDLANSGVLSIEDLSGSVPGLYTTRSVGYGAAPISVRGIGGANGGGNLLNDEPVAVYVDNVYVGRLSFATSDLVDVSSVQVLRGPQGTLYGRNSTAGALLVSNNKATNEFEAYANVGAAEYGEKRMSGAVSGPIIKDILAARIALGYSRKGGFVGNMAPGGDDLGSSKDETSRLSLRYTPSDDLTIDLVAESAKQTASAATIAVANVEPRVPSTPFIRRDNLDKIIEDGDFELNSTNMGTSETQSGSLTINWSLGDLTLDAITGYREWEFEGAQDSDGTGFSLFTNTGLLESHQFSQEFRLKSASDQNLVWTAGLYYFEESSNVEFGINNFQGLFGAGTNANFNPSQDVEAYAVFANITYNINDKLSLGLGGRYSEETKNFSNQLLINTISQSVPLPVPIGPFPVGSSIPGEAIWSKPPLFEDKSSFTDFSPRALVDYQIDDDISAYISFSEGFKSGGFNSFGLAPAFESEEIKAYEVGLKSELLDRSLRLNIAAFSYDYSNLQVRLPVPTGGVSIQNAGMAELKGIEFEGNYSVNSNLAVNFNLALLDTEFMELDAQQVPSDIMFTIGAPIPLESVDASGNQLTRAPELQFNIGAEYNFDISAALTGIFAFNYRYQDRVFFLETNQDQNTFSSNGDVEKVDVRLTIESNDDWDITIFGQNLTNNRVITQVTALGSYPNAAVNEPRKFGIRGSYYF